MARFCILCNEPISEKRIQAIPNVHTCTTCAASREEKIPQPAKKCCFSTEPVLTCDREEDWLSFHIADERYGDIEDELST